MEITEDAQKYLVTLNIHMKNVKYLNEIGRLKEEINRLRADRNFGQEFADRLRDMIDVEEKLAPEESISPSYYKFSIREEIRRIDEFYACSRAQLAELRLGLPEISDEVARQKMRALQAEMRAWDRDFSRLIFWSAKMYVEGDQSDILDIDCHWNRNILRDNLIIFKDGGFPLPYAFDSYVQTLMFPPDSTAEVPPN